MSSSSSSATTTTTTKTIRLVIVGCGTCALELIATLKTNTRFEIVVVEPRDAIFYKLGAPRALVDDTYITKNNPFFDIAAVLPRTARHERTRATRIDLEKKIVHCENNCALPYDFCVVATGASQPAVGNEAAHSSKAEITARIRELQAQIVAANEICCVGGGFVGSEVAYEIAAAFPAKHVTVVHSGPFIGKAKSGGVVLDDEPCDKFFQQLTKQAQSFANVTLLLNDRVDRPDGFTGHVDTTPRTYTAQSGATVKADLTLWCVAEQIVNPFRDSFTCNERGQIQINKHLQAVGHGEVFCMGDVASKEELKEANRLYYAVEWSKVIYANILGLADKGHCVATYKAPTKMMFATLGPKVGTAEMPIGVVGSMLVRGLKGSDLFLGRTKARLHIK